MVRKSILLLPFGVRLTFVGRLPLSKVKETVFPFLSAIEVRYQPPRTVESGVADSFPKVLTVLLSSVMVSAESFAVFRTS